MKYIPVLSIAGSDSSGGAGIQADIKTLSALGCYAMTAVTAVTAQNTCGVTASMPMPVSLVKAQVEAVLDDIAPRAIKIGMLATADIINTVGNILQCCKDIPMVLDPVMCATSGDDLLDPEAVQTLIDTLMPLATIITPNIPEAERLTGIKIRCREDYDAAGQKLLAYGCPNVLIKGGHSNGTIMYDYLYTSDNEDAKVLRADAVTTKNTHGTGCTLSSAIAAYLARGCDVVDAVQRAKIYITRAIAEGGDVAIGRGHGPVNHFFDPVVAIKITE